VRIGFVKITEEYPGGELVLAYLSRGDYFGEIGLLGGGLRTATCIALDHVEVVKISGDDFRQMVERFPNIRAASKILPQSAVPPTSTACKWWSAFRSTNSSRKV